LPGGCLDEEKRAEQIARLTPAVREELETMMAIPPQTAGRLMDVSVPSYGER
jgi:Mg/Co/Ni transporter MgtE